MIAQNLVDFAICAILSQEAQNVRNVLRYVLLASTLAPVFVRLVNQDVPMPFNLPQHYPELPKPAYYPKKISKPLVLIILLLFLKKLNLPLNLATTFRNLTV